MAASLSIESFEVSRLRLRRTRQQPVWISNWVLVLRREFGDGADAFWHIMLKGVRVPVGMCTRRYGAGFGVSVMA